MKLLKDFTPPEFTRKNYHSLEAREYWSNLFTLSSRAARKAELKSVADGMRDCATLQIPNQNADHVYKKLAYYGLKWKRLYKVGQGDGFSHRAHPPAEGENFLWYSVISKDKDKLEEFEMFNNKGNHTGIGDLLGFPSCCGSWFQKVWPNYRDPLWQQAENTEGAEKKEWPFDTQLPVHRIKVKGHPFCNACLRYTSVRFSFHIPCSFRCEKTIDLVEDWLEVVEDINEDSARATKYILSLPLTWDVNSGWAKVATKPFTVHAGSIESAHRYRVEYDPEPNFLPDEDIPGAVGGKFWPFNELV